MSCSLSSRSNTSKLLTIRSGVTDFGMTILPSWICHLISTCAGVFPCRSATSLTFGLSSRAPRPSGDHASVATPSWACTRRNSSCENSGCSSTWLTAGTIPVASTKSSQVLRREVADADRPDAALVTQPGERLERVHERVLRRQRPVDQIEIQVGVRSDQAQLLHAAVEGLQRGVVALIGVPQLGGDIHLLAWQTRFRERLADSALIPVRRRRVDVAVACLEGRAHRALGLIRRCLENTESDLRDRVTVIQRDRRRSHDFESAS